MDVIARSKDLHEVNAASRVTDDMRGRLDREDERAGRAPAPASNLHVATSEPAGIELAGVAEQLEQGAGAWRACSGCHELIEGHPTGPWSETLKSYMGGGCRECGGIGAIWDNTDYRQVNYAAPMMSSKEADLPVLSEASLPTTSRLSQLEAHKSCAASINDPSTLIDQPRQNHVGVEDA